MEPSENTKGLAGALRDDAQKLQGAATDRLQAEAEAQKDEASKQVRNLSSALGAAAQSVDVGASQWMKSALQEGAQALDRFSRSVEQQDTSQLLGRVQRIARDNPATFLAGCAALGFAAARVLRAGADTPPAPTGESRWSRSNSAEQSRMHRPAVPLEAQNRSDRDYQTPGSTT
jgi:hypothetical protein